MFSRNSVLGIAALTVAGLAGSAHATFFSFASDMNSNAYTFGGSAGTAGSFSLTDFSRPNTFTLLIDDNNGPLPTLSVAFEFRAGLTASAGQSTNITGNVFQHTYSVTGTFGFFNASGVPLLTAVIGAASPAFLTVPGTQNSWSSVGAVLGASSFSDVTYTASSALITAMGGAAIAAQYGIFVGSSSPPADFAFDLSVINAGAIGQSVLIDSVTKAPTTAWRSESSYSGSAASFVPSPGSAALMGAAAVIVGVRRRRN